MANISYQQSVNEWRRERDESIRRENGWLALAGLCWLKLGKNLLGSDPKSEVVLPQRLPASLGYLEYNGSSVSLFANPDQKINVDGTETDFAVLQPDTSLIKLEDVQFVVIQRGNKFGVRIWDNQREERRSFPARTWFDIDENFLIPATYSPYETPKKADFPNVAGETAEFPVDGFLSFTFNNKHYQLDVNKESDGTFFIRFWDPTSKKESYPTGRYLITDAEADGKLFIDFNKAYNPPCSFTDYATCIFAPEQNHLDFRVTAGEKYTRH
ncbi:MAG: DUF1684 domain-containing protein [Chloroflexi bacterium]|nr:DUF1684 domain-containing protein [Chloroflexota bacterium]